MRSATTAQARGTWAHCWMIGLRRFHHPNYIENREVLSYFISSRLEWSNFNYMRPQTADRRSCPGTDSSSSVWKKLLDRQHSFHCGLPPRPCWRLRKVTVRFLQAFVDFCNRLGTRRVPLPIRVALSASSSFEATPLGLRKYRGSIDYSSLPSLCRWQTATSQ